MSFDDELKIRFMESLEYLSHRVERLFSVPVGFITDFASIPRIAWSIFPPTGKYGKAAVIHDFIYQRGLGLTQKEADGVFLDAMEELNVGFWTRYTLHRFLRIGGFVAWGRYRKADMNKDEIQGDA